MSATVEQMFARIAKRYDRANTLITVGLHRRWRRRAVRLSGAECGMHVLDCATGTGDFAIEFLRAVGPSGRVVAADICQPMLDVFRCKVERGYPNLTIEAADMLALPYADATFDIVSCGYGVRNADDPFCALAEMARVAKPGGRVVILETGMPQHPLLGALHALYTRRIVPMIGELVTGDRSAYEYLPRTAAAFPSGEAFVSMMADTAAFTRIDAYPLLGGASYIYVGVKRS
ncbi:MAG: demethylmenaquinone methyltransferase [Candidatus Kapaibacterium sp.]|nr:MAG: demethylmenaquinone methyltransferase [Candidatus Kapabacteria bacterium]